jgi:hypothetical protein
MRSSVFAEWSQDAIVWRRPAEYRHGANWTLRVHRDGTAAIGWSLAVDSSPPDTLMRGPVAHAWRTCLSTLSRLEGVSSHYLSLALFGRQFVTLDDVAIRDHLIALPRLRRGPLALEASADQLASLERETRRILEEHAYEPGG